MPNYTYKGDWSKLKQLLKFTVKDDDIVVNEFQVRLTNVPEELSLDEDKLVVKYLDGTNKYVSLDKYASKSDLQYQTARLENDLRLATSAIDASTKQALEDYRTEFLLSDELLDIVSDYADSAAEEANEAINLRLDVEDQYQKELADELRKRNYKFYVTKDDTNYILTVLDGESNVVLNQRFETGITNVDLAGIKLEDHSKVSAHDLASATAETPVELKNKFIDVNYNGLKNVGYDSIKPGFITPSIRNNKYQIPSAAAVYDYAATDIQISNTLTDTFVTLYNEAGDVLSEDKASLPVSVINVSQNGAKVTLMTNYGKEFTLDFSELDPAVLEGKTIDGRNNYICNLNLLEASAPTLVEDGCVLTSVEGYPDWIKPEQVITYDEDNVYANFNGKTKRLQFANDEVTYEGSSRELYEHYIYLRNGKTGKLLQLVIRNAGSEQFTTLTLAKWLHWLGFHGPMYFYPANGVVETKQYWAATMRKIGTELDVDTYAYGVYSGDGETIKACAGSELGVDLSDFALEDKVRKVM